MCQTNSKNVNKWSMKGYRVYRTNSIGESVSFYNYNELMKLNTRTRCRTFQFHMFKDAKSILNWIRDGHSYGRISIYECRLSGNLSAGLWEYEEGIKTVMGDVCTLLRSVTKSELEKELKLKNKKGK